jgi:hypothetical protein
MVKITKRCLHKTQIRYFKYEIEGLVRSGKLNTAAPATLLLAMHRSYKLHPNTIHAHMFIHQKSCNPSK